MRRKNRKSNLFGAPASFAGSQLPAFEDVGKQWAQSRIELQSEHPGTQVCNTAVAAKVKLTFISTISEL